MYPVLVCLVCLVSVCDSLDLFVSPPDLCPHQHAGEAARILDDSLCACLAVDAVNLLVWGLFRDITCTYQTLNS